MKNHPLLPRPFSGGLLRRLYASDLAEFQAYRSIPELGRYQGWSPLSDAEALTFLNEMNAAALFTPGQWVQLGIAEPNTENLIGDVGLFLTADEAFAEVGFTLAPASQGRGIATAAVRASVELLFAATNAQQIRGVADSRNTPSIRVLQRAGFHHTRSQQAVFRGEPCCEDVYVRERNEGQRST